MSVEQVRKAAWSYVLDQPTRILVADDDPILREFASVYLSTPTATVVTAPDGLAALDLLKAETCDVAVIDIGMPVLDGFGLLEGIRADVALSQLPVMMLTGHEDIASIDRAFTLGANGFATKPVNWRLLSYQIRYVLRSCALERDAVTRLNAALATALKEPVVRERMATFGVQIAGSNPQEADAFVKAEIARWGDVIRRYKIKPE